MRFLLPFAAWVASLSLAAPVAAQFQGHFPRTTSPNTWDRENDGNPCPSPTATTTRSFEVFGFAVTAAGTYTVTATRTGGGFIAMDFYQGAFAPGFQCANFISKTEGTNSVSMTFPVCSGCVDPFWNMYVVISGASAADAGDFTVNVTGPGTTQPVCTQYGTISPTSQSVAGAGGSFSATYTPHSDPGCRSWTSSNVPAWITGVPASGTGPLTFTVNAAANGGAMRTAQLRFGTDNPGAWPDYLAQLSVSQATNACSYGISSPSSTPGAGATSLSFNVTTAGGCTWTAASNAAWLTTSSSGSGNGTVTANVAANAGPQRVGQINVAGQVHTVTQASGCAVTLASASGNVAAGAGSSSAPLQRSDAACGWSWTASTSTSWISLPSGSGTTATVPFNVTANTGPVRVGTITVNGQTFTVTQASGCAATFAPTSASLGNASGASSVTVTMSNAACTWTATTSTPWITGVTGGATGNGTVSFNYQANTGPARSGAITINGQSYGVTQADGCTTMLSSASRSVGAPAGSDTITVTMSSAACTWTASHTGGVPWITSFTAGGTGTGTFTYAYQANVGPMRSTTFTIGGQTLSVSQANGCTSSLPASGETVAAAGGTETAAVTMSAGTCPWSASTSTPWITVTTPSGSGSGNVGYTFAQNVGPERTGTITIDGKTFTVTQANGCTATLASPSSVVGAAGGSGGFGFTVSDPACAWTASTSSPFLTLTSATTGTGNGTITFSAPAHQGPERVGTITLLGQTHTVTQSSGCVVAVAPMSSSVTAAGGTTTFAVQTEVGCTWSAASLDAFVTSVTPSGSGPGTVTVAYAANPGLERTGTVEVLSTTTASAATFTFTQADGCVGTLAPTSAGVGSGGSSESVTLTMSDPACPWTASSDSGFVTVATPSGTGSAAIGYVVAPHDGPLRTATLTIAGNTFVVTQASGCTITVAPTSESVSEAAAATTFTVTTAAGCGFTTSESVGWITGVTPSGVGAGGVTVTYEANVSVPRSGVVRVSSTDTAAFADFTLAQADGCTASLDAATASFGEDASAGSVTLTMSDAACPWDVTTGDAWLEAGATSGNGSATIAYDVLANVGPERTGTLTIAGETHTVTQASGCTIDITPASVSVDETEGTTSFDVATGPGCVYDVSTTTTWLEGVSLSATGPGTYTVGYDANTGIERVGALTLATDTGDTETFTLTQADGCVVTLGTTEADVVSVGGTSDFVVTMGEGCGYTVASDATWLSATTISTGVEYVVPPWDGPARTATITVTSTTSPSSATFVVTQASGCVIMLSPGSASIDGAGETLSFEVLTAPGCTFTASSPDDFIANVTVAGNLVSFGISENGRTPRTGTVVVTSDTTNSTGTFVVQQAEGDGRPGDGGVATGVVPVGDGCSATPSRGAWPALGAFALVVLMLVRRRRGAAWIIVAPVVLVASRADAQAFADGYDLARHRPATSARIDYGTVESGEARLSGHFELGGSIGYDIRPLVVTTTTNEDARAVAGQLWLRVSGAFALGERFRLNAQMPFVLARHGDMAVLPDYPDVDRAAVGDLLLVPKVALVTRTPEDGSPFGRGVALALLVPVTFPTGQAGRLAGEHFTVEPRVALDVGSRTGLGAALNVGFRIREARELFGNELDEEVTLGLAGRVPLAGKLFAIGEIVTDVAVRTDDNRNASRGEVLASLRYAGDALVASGGVGAGFLGGLATPRFRIFASVTYAPSRPADAAPPPSSEPAREPEPAPEPSPVAAAEPEPVAQARLAAAEPEAARGEETPAEESLAPNRCEANPSLAGCPRTALCGTDDARAARDEAGLETISAFELDSAALPPGGDAAAARIAARLDALGEARVVIVGHTDLSGGPAHNEALSRARADTVIEALVRAGVPRSRLVLRGAGSRCASDAVPDAQNRRVEILLVR